jgi:hypothetical protein
VAYLLRLRPVLAHAVQARRPFIEAVGVQIEELRRGDPISISRDAARLGLEYGPVFREDRRAAEGLEPPPECEACNAAIVAWLDVHVAACQLLQEVGSRREPRRLREVQERLADGRPYAGRFNDEYTRIKQDLRERVARVLGTRGRRQGGLMGWLMGLFGR